MEYEIPLCKVNLYLENDRTLLNTFKLRLNEAELTAIKISGNVYYNNRYYNVKNMAMNFNDYNTLEIFLKED